MDLIYTIIGGIVVVFAVAFIKHYLPKILAYKNKGSNYHLMGDSSYKNDIIKVLQNFANGPKDIESNYPLINVAKELYENGDLKGIDEGTLTEGPAFRNLETTLAGKQRLEDLTSKPAKNPLDNL